MKATAVANANIAFVKYWGRRSDGRPYNSSVSMTLDDQFSTKTTVDFSEEYSADQFQLNGETMEGLALSKVRDHLQTVRERGESKLKARVVSQNSFPHGAGLASSASGFCALTAAACAALGLELDASELSAIATAGPSGSAGRSMFGGFVEWDAEQNRVNQLHDRNHWDLRDVVALVATQQKRIASAEAMQDTVKTSQLYPHRVDLAAHHVEHTKQALQDKNADLLFRTVMRDSNNLHATMADTSPPLHYMNDVSRAIIAAIHDLNKDWMVAGYTFDAGPNAHIITTKDAVDVVRHRLEGIPGVQKILVSGTGRGVREDSA